MQADHYVAALPVERLRLLLSPALRAAEPRLARAAAAGRALDERRDVLPRPRRRRSQHGHAIFIDSEWALTAISQAQFWPGVDLEQRGDGRVEGILSVDVSEWERPGPAHRQGRDGVHAARRSARRCGGSSTDHIDDGSLDEANVAGVVPRPGDPVPEPDRRDQPRAAADQHRRLLGRPAGRASRASRTSSSRPTSCARTPTSRRWRARTRRRGGRSTGSSTRPARARRAARCGSCASRRCSRRSARWTACAGGSGGRAAPPPLRVGARRRARAERAGRARAAGARAARNVGAMLDEPRLDRVPHALRRGARDRRRARGRAGAAAARARRARARRRALRGARRARRRGRASRASSPRG